MRSLTTSRLSDEEVRRMNTIQSFTLQGCIITLLLRTLSGVAVI